MENEVRGMTVKDLADFMQRLVQSGGGDQPVCINGKPVVGFGIISAKDGEWDHIELRDTPPSGYKAKQKVNAGSSYKIRRIEPPTRGKNV